MNTKILQATKHNISLVVEALDEGSLVAIPTETVYGLAGRYDLESAVAKVFEVKQRPSFDPLIVHLPPQSHWTLEYFEQQKLIQLDKIAPELYPTLENLMAYFWPGPLTLILPKHSDVPRSVTGDLDTVALRVPAHPVAQAVLNQLSSPLVAPSANLFGRLSPTSADHVFQELQGKIPYVLDGGPCQWGIESTIILCEGEQLSLLRPGALTRSEIRSLLKLNVKPARHHPAEIKAPGMLKRHYAPRKPMYLFENLSELQSMDLSRAALILQQAQEESLPDSASTVLYFSQNGDLNEVAKSLFHVLRLAENSEADHILTQLPSQKNRGLGDAIVNRLTKASEGNIDMLSQE